LQKLHARILLEQGSYAQALAVLEGATLENMDAEHLALRASLQQRTGAHGEAVGSYDRLLAQHGAAAPWLVGRAISLEALGQGDNARTTYQQALRISEIDARLKRYASDRLKALN
jgi:tetratricopeptide (TPR) repeat protein